MRRSKRAVKESHEAANIFPPMSDEEYASLKADIKENGRKSGL
jgi:hypothetical protein